MWVCLFGLADGPLPAPGGGLSSLHRSLCFLFLHEARGWAGSLGLHLQAFIPTDAHASALCTSTDVREVFHLEGHRGGILCLPSCTPTYPPEALCFWECCWACDGSLWAQSLAMMDPSPAKRGAAFIRFAGPWVSPVKGQIQQKQWPLGTHAASGGWHGEPAGRHRIRHPTLTAQELDSISC